METQNYQAILLFWPTDTLQKLDIHYTKKNNFLQPYLGNSTYQTHARHIVFNETFNLQLYVLPLEAPSTWSASLTVKGDISKKRFIANISNLLIKRLKKSRIISQVNTG